MYVPDGQIVQDVVPMATTAWLAEKPSGQLMQDDAPVVFAKEPEEHATQPAPAEETVPAAQIAHAVAADAAVGP